MVSQFHDHDHAVVPTTQSVIKEEGYMVPAITLKIIVFRLLPI